MTSLVLQTFAVFTGDVTHCLEEGAVYVNRKVQLKIKIATECSNPYVSKRDVCSDKGSEKGRQTSGGERLNLKTKENQSTAMRKHSR